MTDSLNIVVQSGGALLDKGGFGCIFTPPLVCNGQKKENVNKNKIGKLTEISELKNEINTSKVLSQFPESKKYLILPEIDTICKPSIDNLTDEFDMNKCTPLKKYGFKDMMQFELEYGGKALKYRINQMNDGSPTDINFFDFMGDILEIGAFLALHGAIHNDIHPNNIVMLDRKSPRLIDFGHSFMYNAINKNLVAELSSVLYNPELPQIPPEISLYHGMYHSLLISEVLNDIKTQKSSMINAERILGLSRERQILELEHFWNMSKSVQQWDFVSFYKTFWTKIDSWAIGSDILSILKRFKLMPKFTEGKEWKQKGGLVQNVLRGLMQSSPAKRFDCVYALSIYDPTNALVSSPPGKAWLNHLQA